MKVDNLTISRIFASIEKYSEFPNVSQDLEFFSFSMAKDVAVVELKHSSKSGMRAWGVLETVVFIPMLTSKNCLYTCNFQGVLSYYSYWSYVLLVRH